MKFSILFAAAAVLTACAPAPQAATETTDSETSPARAVIVTSLGDITVELAESAAPVSSANFLAHAEAGHYDGGGFYRSVRDDNEREGVEPMNLIQGGHSFDGLPGADGVAHESTEMTGLSHVRGAISMARNEPGTATTEFFIMVADYPGLDSGPGTRNPDEAGYAVFGQVVDGMDVVEAIWMSQTSLAAAPEDFQYPQFIVEPVVIETVRVE
ncbi:MAG: peptidylprolyl isomerase [Oceanicaulis sp.]